MAGTTRLSNTTLFRRNHVGNGLSSASVAGAAAAAFVVFGRRQERVQLQPVTLPNKNRLHFNLLRFRTAVGVVAVGLILERGVARGEPPSRRLLPVHVCVSSSLAKCLVLLRVYWGAVNCAAR